MTQGTDPEGRQSLWGARRAPLQAPAVTITPAVRPVVPEPMQTEAPSDRVYQAFETHERAARLNIRCARIPSRYPGYNYLLDVIYDYDFSASFTLIYTFMVVEVKGRNLDPVVHAIAHGSCGRITEFHPRRHEKPAGDDPIIESVEIVDGHNQKEEEKDSP